MDLTHKWVELRKLNKKQCDGLSLHVKREL